MPKNYFAANLRFLRRKNKQTQADIGLRLNKRPTAISSYENGESEPGLDDLLNLCDFFGVSLNDLVSVDLQNVHLSEKNGDEKSGEKVHPIVHGNVHPSDKNEVKPGEMTISYTENGLEQVADVGVRYNEGYSPVPKVVVVDLTGKENAVFVPVKARAGYLTGYGDPEFIGSLEAYKVPGSPNRSYRLFEVDGNSMFSTLHDKDTAKAYWVRLSDIVNDQVYVLITKRDGIIIKRIIKTSTGDLLCKSDNDDKSLYPNYIVPIKDVLEVWRVQTGETHNLAKPGDVYKRIVELEANIATIMTHVGLLKAPEN